MRRISNGLVVLCLAVSLTASPMFATPRRDDGDGYFRDSLKRIVQVVKKVVKKLDGGDMSIPKP
jgi:hypothetical protein